MESEDKLGMERELEIMQQMDNPFIIKYYDKCDY